MINLHFLTRLENSVKKYWDFPVLCNYRGSSYTYGQMATQIAKFDLLLKEAGVNKGDRIAICAKNSANWGIAFFSTVIYEAVAVPILVDFHPESVNGLVDHSESVILFTDNDVWQKLNIEKMPLVKAVISTTDFSLLYAREEAFANKYKEMDEMFAKKYPSGFGASDVKYPTGNDKDLAIINYTSGSTGTPKGVMLRYECISANVDFAQDRLPCDRGDQIVSMLPMAHMYGMMFEFIYPACCGATVYYLGKMPTPAVLLGAMAEVKPYLIITVPLVMEKIFKGKVQPALNKPIMKVLTKIPGVNQLIFKKIRTTLLNAFGGKVRVLVMGGAALNPEVETWFKRFKLPFTIGYGMTEASPLLAYEPWDTFVPRSCGKAVESVEVRIDSSNPQKIVGEIQARGISIMSGYFKNEEATKAAFTADGWMNTGDLGIIDKKGNIFIKGRSKNMILSANGQNIYPEEIEAAFNNQDYVLESVVVSRGVNLVALVYFDNDKLKNDGIEGELFNQKVEEIRTNINLTMPVYSKISEIEVRKEPFEKTPKMSIKRFLYS
ncbi:MAG: AMP-binding protein [Bacteroidales bacterium]|nr:AMP-binding protein [Bacteroidales bacterium]